MIKQNQEIMMVYQKYKINPISGCLFAFIQLPIFIAFFEAIQALCGASPAVAIVGFIVLLLIVVTISVCRVAITYIKVVMAKDTGQQVFKNKQKRKKTR